MECIEECREFSRSTIEKLKSELSYLECKGCSVVTNGSFARFEAHQNSDCDFFILSPSEEYNSDAELILNRMKNAIERIGGNLPSNDGAFNSITKSRDLLTNIGGKNDTNERITRRVLFLVEGKSIICEDYFVSIKKKLIERYISDKISEHQLALFFLNDLIRYYRTICVDFENKTAENGKEWGIRNIKLVFSRKLLYFGGILMAAETAQQTFSRKRDILFELSELTPIDRVSFVFGSSADSALNLYDDFLRDLRDCDVRNMLCDTDIDRRTHSEKFRELKNKGQHFTFLLLTLLNSRYPSCHPIHKALVM